MKIGIKPASYDKKVALLLQGGGALGSFQAGVYEALARSNYVPDWVAGISIGAINAAIIAGNAPENRVAQLRGFWDRITSWAVAWPTGPFDGVFPLRQQAGAATALMFGQPGFFAPRNPLEFVAEPKPVSYYNTAALKATLEQLVDFDRINDPRTTRLAVGACNVRTGRFAYFDSDQITIRAEHIMASGALPPGFPAVEIDGEFYWDGGLVSNTPLSYVIDCLPRRSTLSFQVDVFQAYGKVPETLEEVAERDKDIRYSSRTRMNTDLLANGHKVRHAINELWSILPAELRDTPQAKHLYTMGCVTEMDIVQLIYRPFSPQGSTKDYEFSRVTMNERWMQGLSDMETTLNAAPWLEAKKSDTGVRMFDVMHDLLVNQKPAPVHDDPEAHPGAAGATVVELNRKPVKTART